VRDRRDFTAAVALALVALPFAARAQPPTTKVRRIGQNLFIEFRWADGNYDRLPVLAAELVIDVLVTAGSPGTLAAKRATTTIPIVMAVTGDAVSAGLVASLAQPGGNVTGSTVFGPEHNVKRLEQLKEVMPRLARAAFLFNPDNPSSVTENRDIESAAKSMKLEISYFEARKPAEFDAAFKAMAKRQAGAVVVTYDAMLNSHSKRIAEIAGKRRLPSAGNTDLAEAGGLIGYGVNLKTARAFGLTIPPSLLGRADQVIE